MNYRCFKNDCKLEAQWFRNCLFSDIYCCENHMEVLKRFHSFGSIFVEPCLNTKDAILEFLTKKKLKREKLRENILASRIQNFESLREALRNLDSDLEEIACWIEKISQPQKIIKKEQDSLLISLTLQPDSAIKKLKEMIPSISDQQNSIRQLYWLNKLRAKTSDIWNRLNISEFEQDFKETCALYENQKFSSDSLVKQAYQEYVKAYHHIKSIFRVGHRLFIYNTEEEREYKTWIDYRWKNGFSECLPVKLPNNEIFFIHYKYDQKVFIIDRNYDIRKLPSANCRDLYPLIYLSRSVYCYSSLQILRYDLDQNRWIYLSFMPRKDVGNCVIFNGNILIIAKGNLLLYSIDINSFSLIPYGNKGNMWMNAKEISFFKDDESLNSTNLERVILIKVDERLYLIEFYRINTVLIYESDVEDEYAWKKIRKLTLDYHELEYCLYNKSYFYFSFLSYTTGFRGYWKFDLDQMDLIEKSYYYDFICLKQIGKKIECCPQTFKFDPDSAAAYINKGNNLCSLGFKLDKIEYYTQNINKNAHIKDNFAKGRLLKDLEMHKEAIECFNEAIKIISHARCQWYYELCCCKGDSLRKLGKSVEAIESYNQYLKIDPKNEILLIKKGNAFLYDLGRSWEAIQCYEKITKISPYYADNYCDNYFYAYYHKGNAYLYDGWNYDAIICYNKAIYYKPQYDPKIAHVYNNKGLALNKLGRNLEAVECYNESIKINPKDAIVYNNKGNALKGLGKIHEAIECYNKSIELEPSDFLLFCNRGRAFNELEFEADALKDFNIAYSLIQKIFEMRYTSDSNKEKLYEWNSNFFNNDLSKDCVELLKKIVQMQEYIIEFKEIFFSLKNASFDNLWVKIEIEIQKKAIRVQMFQFITRVIEFLGSNNHESYDELQQNLYKLEKKAFKIEKWIIENISDLRSLLKGE